MFRKKMKIELKNVILNPRKIRDVSEEISTETALFSADFAV